MNISSIDILTQILLTLLAFIALPILRQISICRRCFFFFFFFFFSEYRSIMSTFNLHLEEQSMDNNMVSKI